MQIIVLIINIAVFLIFFTVILYYNCISRNTKTRLIESEERFRLLYENSPDSIIVLKNGIIIQANYTAAKMTGVHSPFELMGKSLFDFLSDEDMPAIRNNLLTPADTITQPITFEHKLIRDDLTSIYVETSFSGFPVNGEWFMQSVSRDITEKKVLKETLLLDKLKTRFLSNISHEFRTPISGMLSAVQLSELYLRNSRTKKTNNEGINKLQRNISVIKKNGYRMLRLVNNLIDIVRIDSGYFEIFPENTDIISLVEEITQSAVNVAVKNHIELIFDTDIEEKIIACDPCAIERSILNLLSNAIKFSTSGGNITVRVSDRVDSVLISVKDNGIGIPHDKCGYIFDQFCQIDTSFRRQHEGSGIGLFIVKSLVEMHNGSISVKSTFGRGSDFIIKLPASLVLGQDSNVKNYRQQTVNLNQIEKTNIELSDIYTKCT
jgi:PAS domain S-box-containing protein